MVRMAQTFSMRVPLIDGQGNFGSVDGDQPGGDALHRGAAGQGRQRCCWTTSTRTPSTSSRTTTRRENEPRVLPASFPNLLINGANGIAVGMATNIPPHNPGEIIDATLALVADPDIDARRADAHRPRAGFSHRRHHHRPLRHPRRVRDRPRIHHHPRARGNRGDPRAIARRSSSPKSPTR